MQRLHVIVVQCSPLKSSLKISFEYEQRRRKFHKNHILFIVVAAAEHAIPHVITYTTYPICTDMITNSTHPIENNNCVHKLKDDQHNIVPSAEHREADHPVISHHHQHITKTNHKNTWGAGRHFTVHETQGTRYNHVLSVVSGPNFKGTYWCGLSSTVAMQRRAVGDRQTARYFGMTTGAGLSAARASVAA